MKQIVDIIRISDYDIGYAHSSYILAKNKKRR